MTYATTLQSDLKRCLVCGEAETSASPFVAVLTPVRGRHHWLHAGGCHDEHIARCQAERDAGAPSTEMFREKRA